MSPQTTLFSRPNSQLRINGHYFRMFIDGASRNNPGLAGIGIYILKDDIPLEKLGFFIGTKTNNQAEYLALIIGVMFLQGYVAADDMVLINSDSELMVRQMKGEYRVKDPGLMRLNVVANQLLQSVSYDIGHVLREDNKVADALANKGIDHKIRIPDSLLTQLKKYDISL